MTSIFYPYRFIILKFIVVAMHRRADFLHSHRQSSVYPPERKKKRGISLSNEKVKITDQNSSHHRQGCSSSHRRQALAELRNENMHRFIIYNMDRQQWERSKSQCIKQNVAKMTFTERTNQSWHQDNQQFALNQIKASMLPIKECITVKKERKRVKEVRSRLNEIENRLNTLLSSTIFK